MKRRFLRATTILLAVLAIPAIGLSQVTKTKDGYLLRMKWQKGDFFEYTGATVINMSGTAINIPMNHSKKVLDINNGIARVTISGTNPLTREPEQVTVDMNGRGIVDKETAASLSGGNSPIGFQLPEKALKAGDSWQIEGPVAMQGFEMLVKTVYTFAGLEIVDKVPCVKITVVMSGDGGTETKMSMEGEGVFYFKNINGQLFRSTIDATLKVGEGENALQFPTRTEIKLK